MNPIDPARPMRPRGTRGRGSALCAGIGSILVAAGSFVRRLPLLLSPSPRTALRLLCIMAFDTVHMHRQRTPLSAAQVCRLAALLDFGALANAALDRKHYSRHERRSTLKLLRNHGMGPTVAAYLRRLRALERRRPRPHGDESRFQEVRLYREAVVRLSLGMVAAAVDGSQRLDEGIDATYADADLNCLFRLAMQCQIIDDVVDCPGDMSSGLPTFLTACSSLPQAFELIRLAAIGYAGNGDVPPAGDDPALRAALFFMSACARLTIAIGRWRQGCGAGITPRNSRTLLPISGPGRWRTPGPSPRLPPG